ILVQAVFRADPDVAFAILEEANDGIVAEAIGGRDVLETKRSAGYGSRRLRRSGRTTKQQKKGDADICSTLHVLVKDSYWSLIDPSAHSVPEVLEGPNGPKGRSSRRHQTAMDRLRHGCGVAVHFHLFIDHLHMAANGLETDAEFHCDHLVAQALHQGA